jgi:hypothetical protein
MTPQELLAVYSPFLINWFLVWLTNVAERATPPAPAHAEKEDPIIIVNTHHNHGKHHGKHRHHHHHPHTDSLANMVWNVSSFLRGDHC